MPKPDPAAAGDAGSSHGIATLSGLEAQRILWRREQVFLLLSGLFLGTLAMLNILGISRFIVIGSYDRLTGFSWGSPAEITFAIAVGVLPYPLTFLCTDLISEFYGRRRANAVVFVGFLVNLWVMAVLWLGGVLPGFEPNDPVTGFPPLPHWDPEVGRYQETGWTFYQIRFLAFGAVTASMVAYLVAQLVDIHLFHFWKWLTRGKHLWLRNNASTLVSQGVDTVAVILITHFYARALPMDSDQPIGRQLAVYIATGYAVKFVATLLDTPIIYLAVAFLKRYLQIDPVRDHTGREPVFSVVASDGIAVGSAAPDPGRSHGP